MFYCVKEYLTVKTIYRKHYLAIANKSIFEENGILSFPNTTD